MLIGSAHEPEAKPPVGGIAHPSLPDRHNSSLRKSRGHLSRIEVSVSEKKEGEKCIKIKKRALKVQSFRVQRKSGQQRKTCRNEEIKLTPLTYVHSKFPLFSYPIFKLGAIKQREWRISYSEEPAWGGAGGERGERKERYKDKLFCTHF